MSTNAPPAYAPVAVSGPGEGASAPPPAYNASAPAQPPPAYNASAPSQAPVQVQAQAQPTIKYVDANGNPVAPPVGAVQAQPQPTIKYVDQYGNPVAAPTVGAAAPAASAPTANIRYVDQYGNPVAPPTQQVQPQPAANIRYVDQFGNPIAPPVGAVQPQPQPTIRYVDQNGNPVAPPVGAAAVKQPIVANATTTTPGTANSNSGQATETPKEKQQRTGAGIMGLLACLLLFIGMCVDQLATASAYGVSIHCGWASIHGDLSDSQSYGELCSGSYDESYNWESGDSTWCGTQAAAAISLVLMLASFIAAACATLFVQPWTKVTPCCCRNGGKPARTNFGVSIFLSLISIIAWTAGDDNCLSSESTASLGGSHICQIIAMIFNFIALILAKNN